MADEKIISIELDTKVDNTKLGKYEVLLSKIQKERAALLKQQKIANDLNRKELELTKEQQQRLGQLNTRQKALSKGKSELAKKTADYNKVMKDEGKSYDALTAKNAILAKRLRALKDPLGKNKAEFEKLAREIKSNTNQLSEMDEAQGRFFRNVGNYPDMLGKISPALGGMITGLQGMVKASLAFIATPLGAVLAAIAALATPIVAFFTKSQKGMDMLSEATAGVTAFIDVFIDRLLILGEGMVDFLTGDFDKGINKITTAFKGMGDEIERETKAAIQLQKELNKLEKDETAQTVKSAVLQQRIAKLRAEAAENEEINAAKSAELVREAIKLAEEQIEAETELKKRRLSNILALQDSKKEYKTFSDEIEAREEGTNTNLTKEEKLRERINQVKEEGKKLTIEELGLSNSTLEDLEEANDLLADIINTETAYFNTKRKFQKELNTLDKKAKAQQKETDVEFQKIRIEGEIDFFAKKKSLLEESIEEEEELVNDGIDREIEAQKKKNAEIEAENKKRQQTAILIAQSTAATLSAISTQTANKQINELKRQRDNNVITEEQYQNKANEIRKKDFENQKKLQIVQASINAAIAISRAFSDYAYPASVAIAALAGTAAGVQIAAIEATEYVPTKFADGGLLKGASHDNGGIPMSVNGQAGYEAEGGEAIINKKSTSMFLPLLSAINQAGGGVSFDAPTGIKKFAVGGLTPNISGLNNNANLLNAINNRIDRIQVVNVATDTAQVANRVNNIQTNASFG